MAEMDFIIFFAAIQWHTGDLAEGDGSGLGSILGCTEKGRYYIDFLVRIRAIYFI